ncbi:unnamed protein product [Anisakis simplex]|uniref:Uncharacterized protein n=1 Tax=Anisakis simplex TaxID=6269 RepID=A0A0M3K5D4_ANISI|nr:unnamed protein product [Anisakis simplex]
MLKQALKITNVWTPNSVSTEFASLVISKEYALRTTNAKKMSSVSMVSARKETLPEDSDAPATKEHVSVTYQDIGQRLRRPPQTLTSI